MPIAIYLMDSLTRATVLQGDKGLNPNGFCGALYDKGIAACISSRRKRKTPARHEQKPYMKHHRIAYLLAHHADYCRTTTRYERHGKLFFFGISNALTTKLCLWVPTPSEGPSLWIDKVLIYLHHKHHRQPEQVYSRQIQDQTLAAPFHDHS